MLDDFVKEYVLECQEGLARFESELLELEKHPDSTTILSSIFRVVHSIKGASGFLGFDKMAAVTHEGEELLGMLREGNLRTDQDVVNALLALIDAMRGILNSIETSRTEGERDDSALIRRLQALRLPAKPTPSQTERAAETTSIETVPPADRDDRGEVSVDEPDSSQLSGLIPKGKTRKPKSSRPPLPVSIASTNDKALKAAGEATILPSTSLGETTIRVEIGLLDSLMNLVGELVLTRNQILRCSTTGDDAVFLASSQKLNLITTELQEGMMKTRMQPIRNISAKLPRVVRDLALACGKQAVIVLEGDETELDRTLCEAIKDPITHIIRNAVDHGIESAEVRRARNKPPEGLLRLRAFHEGGMVNIEVSDDGNGIDPARIRIKAVERGWLTAEQAGNWSDRELVALIFRPGFSTAESLTMVSGRGVGMDVVKSRVESIGGRVEATSRVGEGTTILMKIPLTLTIINALIVGAGDDRFAIPQVNLVELMRLDGEAATSALTEILGIRVCRYRGRLLPLLDLNEVLKTTPGRDPGGEESVSIVVLQADHLRFGLIVDRIDDAQEIVVRPLARHLKGIACLAGATIMGDGRIALILDSFGLSGQFEDLGLPAGTVTSWDEPAPAEAIDERSALVVLRGTDAGRMAVPLADVDRLETFPRATIEWVGGRPLVQYRKALLPLVDVAAWLRGEIWLGEDESTDADRTWHVVIHVQEGRRIGLVFDRVIDIVHERLEVTAESNRTGVSVMAVVQGRATEVIDIAPIRAWLEAAPAQLSRS